jgi:hypothetical protein
VASTTRKTESVVSVGRLRLVHNSIRLGSQTDVDAVDVKKRACRGATTCQRRFGRVTTDSHVGHDHIVLRALERRMGAESIGRTVLETLGFPVRVVEMETRFGANRRLAHSSRSIVEGVGFGVCVVVESARESLCVVVECVVEIRTRVVATRIRALDSTD